MQKIRMEDFLLDPNRYELRPGKEEDAPTCPFGNKYKWIGFDRKEMGYVRFTTSVFKLLVKEKEA